MRRSMLALLLLSAITNGTAPVFGTQAGLVCCVCAVDIFKSDGGEVISPGPAPLNGLRPALSCREIPLDQTEAFASQCEERGASSVCFKKIMGTDELLHNETDLSCVETIAEFGFACPTSGAPALSGSGIALLLGGLTALGMAAVRQRIRRRV